MLIFEVTPEKHGRTLLFFSTTQTNTSCRCSRRKFVCVCVNDGVSISRRQQLIFCSATDDDDDDDDTTFVDAAYKNAPAKLSKALHVKRKRFLTFPRCDFSSLTLKHTHNLSVCVFVCVSNTFFLDDTTATTKKSIKRTASFFCAGPILHLTCVLLVAVSCSLLVKCFISLKLRASCTMIYFYFFILFSVLSQNIGGDEIRDANAHTRHTNTLARTYRSTTATVMWCRIILADT